MWPVPLILLVAIGFGALVLIIVAVRQAEKNRTAELARAASEMDFSFQPDGQGLLGTGLSGLPLFQHGRSKKVKNVMRKLVRGTEVTLFDYQYVTSAGEHQQTHRHTVAAFHADDQTAFPKFEMRPENFLHRLGALFGYQDINFETHPGFSRKYLVRGADEAAVRGVFTAPVLDFFQNQPDLWCAEAHSDWLAVYKTSRAKPGAIQAFLADSTKAFLLLAQPSGASESSELGESGSQIDPRG